jgi:hypothetical protein
MARRDAPAQSLAAARVTDQASVVMQPAAARDAPSPHAGSAGYAGSARPVASRRNGRSSRCSTR